MVHSTQDYAYGFNGCTAMALGTFDRSCVTYALRNPLCPDNTGAEGICAAEMSQNNADTYSFVGTGVYFSKKCRRIIPLPGTTTSGTSDTNEDADVPRKNLTEIAKKRMHTRDLPVSEGATKDLSPPLQPRVSKTTCPIADYIVFDGDERKMGTGIKGYAHFGDSYASGMGTGVTPGDSCRIGSNNYGVLLFNYLDDSAIAWNGPSSCSGNTTKELINHINAWPNPADTTLATLTIGGNDVGFSDLVWNCVLTPYARFRNAEWYREQCCKHKFHSLSWSHGLGPLEEHSNATS